MEENGDYSVSELTRFIKTHIPRVSAVPELIVFCVILRHTQSILFLKYKPMCILRLEDFERRIAAAGLFHVTSFPLEGLWGTSVSESSLLGFA